MSRDRQSMDRRAFLGRAGILAIGAAGVGLAARRATGQDPAAAQAESSNLFPMDQTASRPIALPPKPGGRPSMTVADRDALEHSIRCQCGCTLDVYTCRTTDFSCRVSPAMHRDVIALVQGGYSAPEILAAFVKVYGERVLMAPSKEGFNLLGWLAPFVAVAGGGVAVVALLRSWKRHTPRASASGPPVAVRPLDATEEELARLEAAIRDDS